MNLANKVTISRILLVPIFLLALIINIKYAEIEIGKYIAALIFIIAASTDGIDGYIARKRQQVTTLGKFLDPLADKLLVTAALIWLVENADIPSWMAIIIIGREFIVTGVRLVAAGEGVVIAASIWGKLKTIIQIIALASSAFTFSSAKPKSQGICGTASPVTTSDIPIQCSFRIGALNMNFPKKGSKAR